MKVYNLKINGITNPVGFAMERVLCSWLVGEAQSQRLSHVKIEVGLDELFSKVVFAIESAELKCYETELTMELKPYTTYYWRVSVTGEDGEAAVSETTFFETAKMQDSWDGQWIGPKEEDGFHPLIMKTFELEKKIKRARLYICGLGVYEAYLNGQKIGRDYLAPFINDYESGFQYQTYNVTDMLESGNQIGVYLGKGWYMGRFGLKGKSCNYGERMAVIGELHLEYEDGTHELIRTDKTWQYMGSDIEDSGIYDGEILNRQLWQDRDNTLRAVDVLAMDTTKLIERYSLPLVVKEILKPAALIHTPAGEQVLDMGQNFAGYISFKSQLPQGTRIKLRFAEILQGGNFFDGNYESANKGFEYISDGREEEVRPHFTYFGMRYVRVEGWPGTIKAEDFTGNVVYSDLQRTGVIETSDPKINRLYENCLWSQKSNFVDMPTDCPQRAERLGWSGDAQVFAPTACYNMDTRAFYRKYLTDLAQVQNRLGGGVPNFIPDPELDGGISSAWGDAAAIIPDQLYRYYGSLKEAQGSYGMMKSWVDYIAAQNEKHKTGNLYRSGMHFGDWLAQDGITPNSFKGGTDDGYIASVYYCHSVELVAEMAQKLCDINYEYKMDAQKYEALAAEIRQAVLDEYYSATGRLCIDTQAAYVIALKFGIYKNKERLVEQFKERLKKDCYEIKCGFIGAPLLCTVLGENGMEDLAYHFLFKESFPSWLYTVNLGATTIWERWNSVLPDGTINPVGMNSLNHYAYGSVSEFLYAHVVGIKMAAPAFQKVLIHPAISMRFRYVKGEYLSASGLYRVQWAIGEDGIVTVHIEVPFGCEAEIVLPGSDMGHMKLACGSYDYSYEPTQDFRCIYDGDTLLETFSKDAEVMALLESEMPLAARFIRMGDKEKLSWSLNRLMQMTFMGFREEQVKGVIDKVSKMTRW